MPNLAMIALSQYKHALIHAGEDPDARDNPLAKSAKAMAAEKRKGIEAFISRIVVEFPDLRFSQLGFDFIATQIPNGFAIHVPNDNSYAIGVDPTLHEMLTWLFIAAHWAYRNNKPDFFMQLVVDFVRLGWLNLDVSEQKKRMISAFVQSVLPEYQDLGSWASATCMHFLIGHELAHVHLGHFDKGQPKKMQLAHSMPQENEVSGFDHDREYQADAWSGKALLQLSNGIWENTLARTVPETMFSILALVDDLYFPTENLARHIRATHPPSAARAEALKKIGALEISFPMPQDFKILFALPEFLTSLRTDPVFQEFAQMHGKHYRGLRRSFTARLLKALLAYLR